MSKLKPVKSEINFHKIRLTDGIWMHAAEPGTGPLVVLLHGFPEFWYSWRYQVTFLANHGYRVVAPDLRGYGDLDSPLSPLSYTIFHNVSDLIDVLNYFDEQEDMTGELLLVWSLCFCRPDRVKGFVSLGAPLYPRDPNIRNIEFYRSHFGDGYYLCQFQEPGRAERACARYDILTIMKKFFLRTNTERLVAPHGMEIVGFMETPLNFPQWITEEDLQIYAHKFQKSGFAGPLNDYRALDLSANLLGPWIGVAVTVPTKLIMGEKDRSFEVNGTLEYVTGSFFGTLVPNVEVVIQNTHHFIQQEKPQEVSQHILSFIRKFPGN